MKGKEGKERKGMGEWDEREKEEKRKEGYFEGSKAETTLPRTIGNIGVSNP